MTKSKTPIFAIFLATLLLWAHGPNVARAERWALIIGNNSYPNFSEKWQLKGCESDAELIRDLLRRDYSLPNENTRMVLGAQATRQSILSGLDWLLDSSKPGDALLFFFSGHGAQIKDTDEDEADDLDEVLCPYDFEFTGPKTARNAITDDDLRRALGRGMRDREFVAILDCCHSGTGLRSLFPERGVKYLAWEAPPSPGGTRGGVGLDIISGGNYRGLSSKSYAPPPASDAQLTGAGFEIPARSGAPKAANKSKPGASSGYALISASRDFELAAEAQVKTDDGRAEVHGLLTVAFSDFLNARRQTGGISYGDIKVHLSRPLISRGNIQHPQVEARTTLLNRPFFGGAKEIPPGTKDDVITTANTYQPEPLRVALARSDELFLNQKNDSELDQNATEELGKALRKTLASLPDLVRVVPRSEGYDLLVLFDSESTSGAIRHDVTVLDHNTHAILRLDNVQGDAIAPPLLRTIRRAWLVRNLLKLTQPSASKLRLELRIEEATTRATTYDRRRFRFGESVLFGLRPSHDGFVTLIAVDNLGEVTALYPNKYMQSNKNGWAQGGQWMQLPGPGTGFEEGDFPIGDPLGSECVKAFLTPAPLTEFARLLESATQEEQNARTLGTLRSIGSELDRAVGRRSKKTTAPRGDATGMEKIDWAAFSNRNWAENTLFFTTGQ